MATAAGTLENSGQPESSGAEDASIARPDRSWLGAFSLIVLVGAIAPVVIARHFGAFGIPRGDDVAYILSAFRFADAGKIDGNHWPSMNLVGQLVMSAPAVWLFGHRVAALQLEVVALSAAGLFAVFDLAKQLLSPRRALFVALLVAVGPLWASLTVSYYTDVPAFAFAMVSLALGARAVRRDGISMAMFFASLGAGFIAFTVREYALVVPLAVGLTALWAGRGWDARRHHQIVSALAGLVTLAAVVVAWRRTLPGFENFTLEAPTLDSVDVTARRAVESALLLGLLVSPAVMLAGPLRVIRAAWARARWVTLVVGLYSFVLLGRDYLLPGQTPGFLSLDSVILNQWTLGVRSRPVLVPESLLKSLALLGLLSLIVLVCGAIPPASNAGARARAGHVRPPTSPALAMVALATAGFVGASVLASALHTPFFTRYLLALIPLLVMLVLSSSTARISGTRWTRVAAVTAFVVVSAFGAVYGATSASFDGTKWDVARAAAAHANDPRLVDGGFEWNNWHARTVEYRFAAHPRATCIGLAVEGRPSSADRTVVSASQVWTPDGADLWIVARHRAQC
jgi:hypothetical protein